MDTSNPVLGTAASDARPEPRSVWETVLTTTPVVLTVLATLLAGLSSSEMTQAQYFRSLAAQSQSKAGDQWGFFQAKRIRGTSYELSVARLPVLERVGHFDPDGLRSAADDVEADLQRAAKGAEQLAKVLDERKDDALGIDRDSLNKALAGIRLDAQSAAEVKKGIAQEFTQNETRQTVSYLKSFLDAKQAPPIQFSPIGDPRIGEALEGISQRKPDDELAPLLRQITPESIRQALQTVEADADAFDHECQAVGKTLNRLERLVTEELKCVRSQQRSVRAIEASLAGLPGHGGNNPSLSAAVNDIRRASEAAGSAAASLYHRFLEIQHTFTARRNGIEAAYNKRAADFLEVQVRKHSTNADRHRLRSQQFFYGMLCAQAGVTVSSLSLAARKRNVLWALAGLAGLVAMGFSLFVYLFV